MLPVKMKFGALKIANQHYNTWFTEPEVGVLVENILSPAYFTSQHSQIRRNDKIEVLAQDGSYCFTLRVLSSNSLEVHTRMIPFFPHEDDAKTELDSTSETLGYKVTWGGNSEKWRIEDNGKVLEAKFATKEIAQARLQEIISIVNK